MHVCVVSVADVGCIDGLVKEAVAPDNTAVCALMRGGAIRKEKCIYKYVKIEEKTVIIVIIRIFVVRSFLFLSFND